MFDEDESGEIEIDELKAMFGSQGVEEQVWEQMLREVDDNDDGVISYDEFVEIMLAQEGDLIGKQKEANEQIMKEVEEAKLQE